MARKKTAVRCAYWWERRGQGMRYVYARGQCKRLTAHPSGYCGDHKYMRRRRDVYQGLVEGQLHELAWRFARLTRQEDVSRETDE